MKRTRGVRNPIANRTLVRSVLERWDARYGLVYPAPPARAWGHIGLQRSVREWALRQGWGGRPVRQEQAQGILIAALGMLAGHFGYAEAA